MRTKIATSLIAATLATVCLPAAAQSPAPATAAVPQDPVIAMRQHWLDADINSFNFRNSAQIFETRTVAKGDAVWPLAAGPAATMPADYDGWARRTFTNALMVIHDGKVVFEDYRNRTTPTDRFISFSMAKTITALLVGLAIEDGKIASIDDPVSKYVPELKGGGYEGVSIRHVLQMRSGVAYEERYDFGANPSLAAQIHMNAIVANTERFADRARTIGRAAAPGSRFNYATLDTAVLGWVLERATGERLAPYMSRRLWQPLGAESDGFFIADGPEGVGRELSGMGYNARLRDFGRIGLMLLNKGRVDRRQVIPASWVEQATTMVPFAPNAAKPTRDAYGYQIWKLDAEPGAYSAIGLAGQFIYVHPASNTVIVKLSHFPNPEPAGVVDETVKGFHAIIAGLGK
ncbi:MAG: 6-aminohexanoate hydrolase [Novosphingobium sp. 28-62-57]|uniref:serine hydrolase domain-containing protein n=1 Tax=unclassified Novosphingobium TaxID=2644732 RepID=UPI000BD1DEC6|nr:MULTISPECIES: serine hydrolase [unclassified Novosphingobium]OYW50325.1 MAG: 6-aminohexanoate hydrolase [Novosphingobium sp. 12-62-10]OYZ11572.1 MAG: 6-aminohexanoate hydrolase [Novosphingobium sp. 28-62-57]OZA36163.1 MAG: 6-aminohexanoate hydrolase [Novosphingobium sp. 17-62-9]HQS70111.1 serine hydrolase [Novosphingobium sp.]